MKTVKEVAKKLRLSEQTLNGWRVQGRGPEFTKLGGGVSYSGEAIQAPPGGRKIQQANSHADLQATA